MSNPSKQLDRRGQILIVCAIAVLAAILLIGIRPPIQIGHDLCPEDESNLANRIAIIIDPTDILNTRQVRDAVSEIVRLIESAPEYSEISLYDVRSSIRPSFHICKPRHPNSISVLQALYINKDFVEQDYEEKFRKPFLNKLDSLLVGMSSNQSPIIKTLQNVSVDAFGSIDEKRPRQVIILSDMFQNSNDWSFFRDPIDFKALLSHPNYPTMTAHDLGSRTNAQEKVMVTVLLLARRGQTSLTEDIKNFWDAYFIQEGTELPTWGDITG